MKAPFEITLSDGVTKQTVYGDCTEYFGIHPRDDDYIITHLKTGIQIASFGLKRTAKECVSRLEMASIPWDTTSIEKLKPHKPKIFEILKITETDAWKRLLSKQKRKDGTV